MKRLIPILMAIAMLGLTFSAVAAAPPASAIDEADAKAGCTYYSETGHNLCAGFRAYWHEYGGLAIFGFPITEEFVDDETGLVTQWFERARFEWHPGEWPARWDVMLGLLGHEYAAEKGLLGTSPFQETDACDDAYTWAGGGGYDMSGCIYFPQTGHNLSGGFLAYWEAYGGLAVFGYPISEEFVEDGMVVQYFERQRFEWHPGEWPARWDVLLGLLGSTLVHAEDGPAPGPTMTVIASGLNQPRGLTVGADGTVYVTEAGMGGDECIEGEGPEGPTTLCFGYSGAITRIADGEQVRIVTDLPSVLLGGFEGIGPQDVTMSSDGTLYVTVGLGQDPGNRTPLSMEVGEIANQLGTLVEIGASDWSVIADIGTYEIDVNPDDDVIDTNPFSLVADNDGFVVTDAGGNALLHITAEGEIETLAVFPSTMVDAPPFLELPMGAQIPMHAVPTGVVVGPDGAYYVGQLTGFPFPVGGASVWRVVPGEDPEIYATGFTNILDIAFDDDGTLYVLEMASNSLLAAEEDPNGALVRVNDDGSLTVVVSQGLILPTGLDIGPDGAAYVSNMGLMTGIGEVVRIEFP